MARSKTSKSWLKEHFDDEYVKRSQIDGYRSRASYKLIELDDKDRFFRPGQLVVDLGAAPGGWSQVAAQRIGHKGRDFTEQSVLDALLEMLGDQRADVVISDMAPNMSGMPAVDIPKSMDLVELALDMAKQVLKPQGVFVAKVFQGEGFDSLLQDMRGSFSSVVSRKPGASRSRSREVYQVCRGFKAA